MHEKSMVKSFTNVYAGLLLLLVRGCQNTDVSYGRNVENVTIGTAQRNICVGMRSADVIAVTGSPHMATKDRRGNETRVYAKIHSEGEVRESGSYLALFLFDGSQVKRSHSSGERTLTMSIQFYQDSRVQDLPYRTTTFSPSMHMISKHGKALIFCFNVSVCRMQLYY
jgi:hypothetical protein